jgi:hypothetical protein
VHQLTDPTDLDQAAEADTSIDEPLDIVVDLLDRARAAGMSQADITIVVALLNTSTVKQAATSLRVTDRTVRNRRRSIVRQLRLLADVA